MRQAHRSMSRRLLPLGTALAAGLLLAGCATGYRVVQTSGGGSYYTGTRAGTPGYYTGYGGAYYPGSYYGGYGWSLGMTFGGWNGWGYPGYGGPWYSGYPYWGCYGCGHWNGGHTQVPPDTPQPWLKPDHPPVPPRVVQDSDSGSAPPIARPGGFVARRPVEGFANRRPLGAVAVAPEAFVRAPVTQPVETGFNRMPARPVGTPPRVMDNTAVMMRPPAPVSLPRAAPPAFRSAPPPAPVRAAAPPPPPAVAPPPRAQRATRVEIP